MNWKFDFSPETSDIFAVWGRCRRRGDGVRSLVCGFRDATSLDFSGFLARIGSRADRYLLAHGGAAQPMKPDLCHWSCHRRID
jgi:hypothetical protein